MKKILAFLSVLALLVSFGMAFSVTGEFFTKFALDNDTWLTLDFETFKFRYSFDPDVTPKPTSYMTGAITNYFIVGTTTNLATLVPAWTQQSLGRYELTGFKASDTLTLGVKFGMSAYGYHQAISATNVTLWGMTGAYTNLSDIGFFGLEIDPQISFKVADNITISEKDLVIQYWSMSQKFSDSAMSTNDTGADNALPKIGIGAQVDFVMSDTLDLNPGMSFTIAQLDGHDTSVGDTNTYKDGNNTLKIYGTTTLSGEMFKFKLAPYFQMDMKNYNAVTANTTTNTIVGSEMKIVAFIGDGKVVRKATNDGERFDYGDNDTKFDTGGDKALRLITVNDQFSINPYFGFETIVSSAYKSVSGGTTNDYANSAMFFAIGANDIKYKIDDTFSIDLQALYAIDNRGNIENKSSLATNNVQINITTMSFGGNLNIQIAPNAVIHAGTTFDGWTRVVDTKKAASTAANSATNLLTINHSALSDPTLELGGEVTVGDFAIKGVIKSQLKLSASSDQTNDAPAPSGSQGGNILTTTQGMGTAWGDVQMTYTKDNGHFKVKFTTGTKEAAPIVGAELGYKF